METENITFRCSSLGYIMTDPRSKNETLSETAKTHCIDVFVSHKYNRNTDVQTKYTNKGLMVEEDSLTLYSRYKKEYLVKNEERFTNEFITGCPDITIKEPVIDIKSSWDIYTFHRTKSKGINKLYYWQLQGYMALTNKNKAVLAYCLIDTPDTLIDNEKRFLSYKYKDTNCNDLLEGCREIDRLMTYGDIPLKERVIEIEVERNEEDIQRIYERVTECRNYINTILNK